MALVFADRVRETTATTGTGAVQLGGSYAGFQPFSVIGDNNTTYYAILDGTATTWEVGIGTYVAATNSLTRTTVLSSSSAGAPVSFGAGNKDVILTQPSERAVSLNTEGWLDVTRLPSPQTSAKTAQFSGDDIGAYFRRYIAAGDYKASELNLFLDGAENTPGLFLGYDNGGSGAYLGSWTTEPVTFWADNAERMRLTPDGDVGIGNTVPNNFSGYNQLRVGGAKRGELTLAYQGGAAAIDAYAGGHYAEFMFLSNTEVDAYGYGAFLGSIFAADSSYTFGPAQFSIVAGWTDYAQTQPLPITFKTAGAERMRLTPRGTLALGTTIDPWIDGSATVLQFPGSSLVSYANSGLELSENSYFDGNAGTYRYIANGEAASYVQWQGIHYWVSAPSGTAGAAATFNQGMMLDVSGNLGIGIQPPAYKLDVNGDINFTGTLYQNGVPFSGGGSGDVVGPASSTNDAIALFDGTTGKLLKSPGATLTFDGTTLTVDAAAPASFARAAAFKNTWGQVDVSTYGSLAYDNGTEIDFRPYSSAGVSTYYGYVGFDSTSVFLGTGSDKPVTFWPGNTEKVRITPVGNVGIGTSTPDAWGVGTVGLTLDATDNSYVVWRSAGTLAGYVYSGPTYLAVEADTDKTLYLGTYGTGEVQLRTGAAALRVLIDATGNVGINNGAPAYKLDVAGDINFTGTLYQNGVPFGGGGSGDVVGPASATNNSIALFDGTTGKLLKSPSDLVFDASGNLGIGGTPSYRLDVASAATTVIRSYASAGNQAYVSVAGNAGVPGTSAFDLIQDGGGAAYLYNRANAYMAFGTNNTERARIHASGGVSIGNTVDPGAGNLSVNGTLAVGGQPAYVAGVAAVGYIIDGGGVAITTGLLKNGLYIPFACTINSVTLIADQTGSIVVDIWKDSYGNYPPTVADSICASAKPTLSSAIKSQDTTLTGWTTTINAGDILYFNVDSATTVQNVTLTLKVTKT